MMKLSMSFYRANRRRLGTSMDAHTLYVLDSQDRDPSNADLFL